MAEEQWRRIIAEVPTYHDAWDRLVRTLLVQGRLRDAVDCVERLLGGDPRLRGTALTLAAQILETTGQLDAALATLRLARRECSNDVAPFDDLCRHLFYRGDQWELEEVLRELVRLQPDNAGAQHNLGTVLAGKGRFQEAADMFRASLHERPDYALQLSLGYALTSAGKRAEAGAAFEQCVHLATEPRLAAEAQRQLVALAA